MCAPSWVRDVVPSGGRCERATAGAASVRHREAGGAGAGRSVRVRVGAHSAHRTTGGGSGARTAAHSLAFVASATVHLGDTECAGSGGSGLGGTALGADAASAAPRALSLCAGLRRRARASTPAATVTGAVAARRVCHVSDSHAPLTA